MSTVSLRNALLYHTCVVFCFICYLYACTLPYARLKKKKKSLAEDQNLRKVCMMCLGSAGVGPRVPTNVHWMSQYTGRNEKITDLSTSYRNNAI